MKWMSERRRNKFKSNISSYEYWIFIEYYISYGTREKLIVVLRKIIGKYNL